MGPNCLKANYNIKMIEGEKSNIIQTRSISMVSKPFVFEVLLLNQLNRTALKLRSFSIFIFFKGHFLLSSWVVVVVGSCPLSSQDPTHVEVELGCDN